MTKKISAALLAVALAAPLGASAQEIKLGDTTLRFNAFAEMALVYVLSGASNTGDLYQAGPDVVLDNSGPDPKLHTRGLGVAYSRFGLSSNTPSKVGAIGMRIEGDFALSSNGTAGQTFTNSKAFRVRHAYGTVGDWLLLGQTWSTFADLNAFADQMDENPTVNLAALRAPMIRVTFPAGPAKIQFAAENPYATLSGPAATRYTLPDLIGRVDFGAGPAALSVRGVVRQFITRDTSTGAAADAELSGYGFGGAVGCALKFGGDTLALDASYGSAMGPYQYGNYGTGDFLVVTTAGTASIEKWSTLGLSAAFTHVWNPQWRTNVLGSLLSASADTAIQNANTGANKQVIGVAANTYYSFAKNAWVGLEVWYNSRTTFATATAAQDNKGSEFRALATTHFDLF
ncbi:MAG: hypothetical protein HZB56_15235 [Deltaproteobacteria bacterium]|nr:hypothetical protein [Deltaproteobacteria bacterium]